MQDPWIIETSHLLFRLLLSVLLGGLVGVERERKNSAAGLRTHILVCLGSCLIMILSIYGFTAFADEPNVQMDPARLAAQVITGVGFLGAGTILFTGKSITGLTTAASVWVVMAIGLAVGAGFYIPAAFSVILVLLILWGLNIIEKRYVNHPSEHLFIIVCDRGAGAENALQETFAARQLKMYRVQVEELQTDVGERPRVCVRVLVKLPKVEQVLPIAEQLRSLPGVVSVAAE